MIADAEEHKMMMEANEISFNRSNPSNSNNIPETSMKTTIFDEAHECLAQSLLMFLYADLRLLSATGRINTKYETLCIASDRVPRTSAAGLAQLPGVNSFVDEEVIESVSPAQIMAILIVELRQEVIAQRKRAKEQIKRRGERGWFDSSESDEEIEGDDDAGVMNRITDSHGRKEFEMEMHAMVRAYNDMLRKDLKGIPEVKMTFTNPFTRSAEVKAPITPGKVTQQTIQAINRFKAGLRGKNSNDSTIPIRTASCDEYNRSHSDGSTLPSHHREKFSTPPKTKLDDEEKSEVLPEGEYKEESSDVFLSTPQAHDSHHRPKNFVSSDTKGYQSKIYDFLESVRGFKPSNDHTQETAEIMSDPGISSSHEDDLGSLHSPPQPRRPTISQQISVYLEKAKEDRAIYNNKYLIPNEDYNTFTNAEDIGNAIFNGEMKMPSKKIFALDESAETFESEDDRNMNETELLDFMTKCINSRDDTKLSFMKDFFKEDSPCATMVKSHAKIVWMNDWYTVKDLMYAISVDKQKKRVTVVFRGAITRPDWNHAFDGNLKKIQNPVKDDYNGRQNTIRVHRGFYTYLMRARKDTGTRKYDEIANKAYEYGSRMLGDKFDVYINGYSLGGGLGALFGFFASTDQRLTRNGPIKIFTYGMPYIASHSLADAFRHQERSNKVQHARIYNSNDIVAYIPFNARPSKRGSTFVHLGIDVKIYPVPKCCECFSKPPRFRYNDDQKPAASYWRALKMNALINMSWPWKIRDKHSLPELQKRLKKALTESEKSKNTWLQKTLDEAYDDLVHKKYEKT